MPISSVVNPLAFFEIRVPKYSETSPEAMAACFKALPRIHNNIFKFMLNQQEALVFEIVTWNQRIYFMAGMPIKFKTYFTSQLTAQYPQALVNPVSDYLPFLFPKEKSIDNHLKNISFGKLVLSKAFYLPLKTYKDFSEIDPISTILGALAKTDPTDKILVQYLITYANKSWQNEGWKVANKSIPTSDPEKVITNPQKSIIEQKIKEVGFNVEIRILVQSENQLKADAILNNVAGSYSSLSHGEGNSLTLHQPFFDKKSLFKKILDRKPSFSFSPQILTDSELASIYHLPNLTLASIRNIAWGGTLKGEAPENLPISKDLKDEEKRQINFFAKTEFKNQNVIFGIKKIDRRKHIYIIGKTGVGKSTLIANMAINDMRNDEGVAVIDPHGDLCEIMLDYIPKHRLNDVVYLDPTNTDRPFRMNPLEVNEPEQAELIASGIVAIFHKLFAYSWGPRLEYILRNTILTLTQIPNTTLLEVPRMLTSTAYRNQVIEKLNDDVLKKFWIREFNALDDRARNEAISPILNKVGQFITSPKLRAILERPQSSIDLEDIMNKGKILILNISQGKIGEDNAALLGAMFITKIQLAAMNRVNIPENERKDFYLYVDEFQNFATSSFIKILSEARKYRLNLTVANQYTAQVEEDVQKAIFGNVGTIMSFLVGSADAKILNQEFGNTYEESDLVGLDNYHIITKLSIDNKTSNPFAALTLPLPKCKNENRDKAIKLSLERYGKTNKKKIDTELEEEKQFQDNKKRGQTYSQPPKPNKFNNNPKIIDPRTPNKTPPVIPTKPNQVIQKKEKSSIPQPQNQPLESPFDKQEQRRQAEIAFEKLIQKGIAQPSKPASNSFLNKKEDFKKRNNFKPQINSQNFMQNPTEKIINQSQKPKTESFEEMMRSFKKQIDDSPIAKQKIGLSDAQKLKNQNQSQPSSNRPRFILEEEK